MYLADTGDLRIESDRRTAAAPRRLPIARIAPRSVRARAGRGGELTVTTRPLQRQIPRTATIGLVALLTGVAAFLLAAPLRRAQAADEQAPEVRESAAERETEALGAALDDLEHDFETGKLDAADHDQLRAELTAALVRGRAEVERAAAEAAEPSAAEAPELSSADDDLPAPAARACAACSREVGGDDRFCAHCGAKLA